jgi:hypothetical protein
MSNAPTSTPRQRTLFDDEPDLHPYLAPVLIKANKVVDACADFIAASEKTLADDKHPIYGANQVAVVNAAKTMQQIIKRASIAVENLRHPHDETITPDDTETVA